MRNGSLFYAQIPWQHQTHPSVFPPLRWKINIQCIPLITILAFLYLNREDLLLLLLYTGSVPTVRETGWMDFSHSLWGKKSAFSGLQWRWRGSRDKRQKRCAPNVCKREREVGREGREREGGGGSGTERAQICGGSIFFSTFIGATSDFLHKK